jgi:hypothetical protein
VTDDEFGDRLAAIETQIARTANVRTERALWGKMFDLFREAGHDDMIEFMQKTRAYSVFELREAWQNVVDPIIIALPRPLRWLFRKMT